MIDRDFLSNKYYTNKLKDRGFPDKWLSGALWMNSQYQEVANKFQQLGKLTYTLLDLEKAIKYNNVFSKEVCKDKTMTIDTFLTQYNEL